MRRVQQLKLMGGCALAIVAIGCGRQEYARMAHSDEASAPMAQSSMEAKGKAAGGVGRQMNDAPGSGPNAEGRATSASSPKSPTLQLAALQVSQPDRYLIKNATVTIEAKDVRAAVNAITSAVTAVKGYSSDMHESTDALGSLSITLSVRIPFNTFSSQMTQIKSLGKVLDSQTTAEDVTEEYVDSDAKVRNLKRTEERLLVHLGKTGKLSDTLLIEKEISRVRQEIEQIEGRLRFLSNRVSFSTIQITLRETARQQALVPPASYSAGQTFSDAARSVVDFGRSLLSGAIWIGVWGLFWIPTLFLARFGWKYATARKGHLFGPPSNPGPMA
ncbi:MAG: DUF4349 domain-containing protein [Chthonomonadales bacterium]